MSKWVQQECRRREPLEERRDGLAEIHTSSYFSAKLVYLPESVDFFPERSASRSHPDSLGFLGQQADIVFESVFQSFAHLGGTLARAFGDLILDRKSDVHWQSMGVCPCCVNVANRCNLGRLQTSELTPHPCPAKFRSRM